MKLRSSAREAERRQTAQAPDTDQEIAKLSRVTRPSKFAFTTVGLMAISFDALNYFVSVGIVIDFMLSMIFVFSVRAMINRPVAIQRLFACLLMLFVFLTVGIPVIGSLFGIPLLLVVLVAGIWNPGAKASSFNRKKINDSIERFKGSVDRVKELGQQLKGAKQLTAKVPGASLTTKAPKTSLRLGVSAGAESVPVVSWLPLNVINSVWTFWDLRKGHREARRLLAMYEQGKAAAEEAEAQRTLQEQRAMLAAFISQTKSGPSLDKPAARRDNGTAAISRTPTAPAAASAVEPAPRRPVVRDVGSSPSGSRIPSQMPPAVPATARA